MLLRGGGRAVEEFVFEGCHGAGIFPSYRNGRLIESIRTECGCTGDWMMLVSASCIWCQLVRRHGGAGDRNKHNSTFQRRVVTGRESRASSLKSSLKGTHWQSVTYFQMAYYDQLYVVLYFKNPSTTTNWFVMYCMMIQWRLWFRVLVPVPSA